MSTEPEHQHHHFVRADLLAWDAEDEGRRQAAAWDRLRRVCIELRVRTPTQRQIQEADRDLCSHSRTLQERWPLLGWEDEWAAVVIAHGEGGEAVWVQFASGYLLGEAMPIHGAAPTPEGGT